MNTDHTPGRPGSSGDASPGDLASRLRSDLDVRAMRVAPTPPPLSDILHRSRRRRNRHRAAGVLAGAGAMTLAGVAVLVRPNDGAPTTELATGDDQGTAPPTTTPPGTVPAAAPVDAFGQLPCGPTDAWYLGRDGAAVQLQSGPGPVVIGSAWRLYVGLGGDGNSQARVFLADADDLTGASLTVSRTTLPNTVMNYSGGVAPSPSWAIQGGAVAALPADGTHSRVVSIGAAEAYLSEGDGTVELSWSVGPDFLHLTSRNVPTDTVLATAQSLQLRGDGGIDVGSVPADLPVALDASPADRQVRSRASYFDDNGVGVSVTTETGTRADFVARVLQIGASRLERTQVRGQEGWLVTFDGQGAGSFPRELIWLDPAHGGFVSMSVAVPTDPGIDLVAIASRLHDLSPDEIQAACDAQAKAEADARAAAAAAAAAASSSPWIDPGSSSPWIAAADGSSSPWTTDTTEPGSSSPWIDPASPDATATTSAPPASEPVTPAGDAPAPPSPPTTAADVAPPATTAPPAPTATSTTTAAP